MQKEITILLIDPSAEDRAAIHSLLEGKGAKIIEAADAAQAWEVSKDLRHISLLVADLTAATGGEILDLRDHLEGEIGVFPSVLTSYEDMTPFYSRVYENERLFFKPVNRGAFLEWFDECVDIEEPKPKGEVTALLKQHPVSSPPPEIATEPSSEAPAEPLPQVESVPIQLPEDALPVGTRLGDYKLLREIQEDANFALYEAEQTSIGRRVALKTLYRKHRRDINWVQGFVNEASARASVNHPAISLVYECDQELGVNFYTLELVDAPSLSDLARRRSELSEPVLWKVLESSADALIYLRDNGMSHRMFTAQSILIVKGEEPRIANPVRGRGQWFSPAEERQQMGLLGEALAPFAGKSGTSSELFSLIDRLGTDRVDGINTASALKKALEPIDPHAGLSDKEIAVKSEQETNRKALITGAMIGLLIVAVAIFAVLQFFTKPAVRDLDGLSKIPSGVFPFGEGEGEQIDVSEFWMGQYEVTIADYAKFLDAVNSRPDLAKALRHPDQPESKVNYEPERWNEILSEAMKGGKFYGGEIDPNCPVVGVDWWDAHAYATWRGGRLPTEQEWEKSARGRAGNKFPWGDEMVAENFNSGIDHEAGDDVEAGATDGYKYWCPVDAIPNDESRYGVVGLAGNVSEWTATWGAHPDQPDKQVPLKRGASFATQSGFELTARRAAESADERNFWTGFRIVADSATPALWTGSGNNAASKPAEEPSSEPSPGSEASADAGMSPDAGAAAPMSEESAPAAPQE